MKSKHTPGPWKICIDTQGNPLPYEDDSCIKVVSIIGSHYAFVGGKNRKTNARLIAAAPKLLATLKAIVALINGEWDLPELMAMGPIEINDASSISKKWANAAIREAEEVKP